MSDNTNRHTASCMSEFFTRLANAIREGKSDAQVLKRFIVAAVLQQVFIPVFRNADGEFTESDRKTLLPENAAAIQVPMNTEGSVQGWTESAELYFATWEAYLDLKCTYPDEMAKDAIREVRAIIKTACSLAANELGIKGSRSLESTSIKLDFGLTAEDLTAKLIGAYAKDGDYTKLSKVADLLGLAAIKASETAEAASEEVPA